MTNRKEWEGHTPTLEDAIAKCRDALSVGYHYDRGKTYHHVESISLCVLIEFVEGKKKLVNALPVVTEALRKAEARLKHINAKLNGPLPGNDKAMLSEYVFNSAYEINEALALIDGGE